MSILHRLIEQSKRPDRTIGKIMLKIMNRAHLSMTKSALSKLRIHSNAIILDIGCGGGETIHLLAQKAAQGLVYGVDFSETAVEMSRQRNIKEVTSGRVYVVRGEVSQLPFSDHSFDIITAIQTHYYWPDIPKDVEEIYRVLKPGGQFMIASEIYKVQYHMDNYTTCEEMEAVLMQAGFKVNIEEHNKWRFVLGYKK